MSNSVDGMRETFEPEVSEVEALRSALKKALFWLSSDHVQGWWGGNELFQADYQQMKSLMDWKDGHGPA